MHNLLLFLWLVNSDPITDLMKSNPSKRLLLSGTATIASAILMAAQAGEPFKADPLVPPSESTTPTMADPFDRAIRPITNPALFDLAVPRTQIHPIFMHQSLPNSVNTTIGKVPVDGDFQLYAVQLEWALNDRFSLIALKDGYIDLNPDATLSDESGFANLAAGLKWVFWQDPADRLAMSLSAQIEVPTGNGDVFQGTGSGAIIPTFSLLKLYDRFQFSEALGVHLPFDSDEESTMLFYSAHLSYELTEQFFPLIELNYFRVLDEGDGNARFQNQVGGAVPGVARFEGGDLINLGASNGSENADLLTLGMGFRYRFSDNVDLGLAYEIPLTSKSDNLMNSRITADLVWRF